MEKQRAFSIIISRGVIGAGENDTATYASKLMDENNIGAIVIMKGEKLVGIVSERDIVRKVVALGLEPDTTKIKDFMTRNVVAADMENGLNNIYQTLCKSKFRHLPIMHKGKLVGIASQRDVLYGLRLKNS